LVGIVEVEKGVAAILGYQFAGVFVDRRGNNVTAVKHSGCGVHFMAYQVRIESVASWFLVGL